MNTARLDLLFKNYIEKFDYISFCDNNETYKWEIVQSFQEEFDLESDDFAEMLNSLWRKSENLIDNSTQLPFFALVDYARNEPETVRDMFAALYEDDGGDLALRQKKIDQFIAKTEELREKYKPDSWRYVNDQRSVMSYLFLHDPDHNYLYKSTQAHEFADCVEFYDDWGSGTNFKLPVYYRMCDELVEALRSSEKLMAKNEERFKKGRNLYPDEALHILCFDMIYSSQVYGLYGNIEYTHPNSAEKRAYLEKKDKALQLKAAYEELAAQAEELEQAKEYLSAAMVSGTHICHKTYGDGIIESLDNGYLSIRFAEPAGVKRFGLLSSLVGGFILPNTPSIAEYIKEHAQVMKAEASLPNRLKKAEADLAPYKDLL